MSDPTLLHGYGEKLPTAFGRENTRFVDGLERVGEPSNGFKLHPCLAASLPVSEVVELDAAAQSDLFLKIGQDVSSGRDQSASTCKKAVEPTALLREQPRYVESLVLAEVGSVSQQRVVLSRGPSTPGRTRSEGSG